MSAHGEISLNIKNYKAQIENIDNEVKEFHPLLQVLLPKLANVMYVEYTHGPNEMGADFVIERHDPELGETYYIGIVAKTDKIIQNFTDVERQIDECQVPRLIRQGKQQVTLPEVWVITTKHYSQNAKQKIQSKYPGRKLHFFDADWLVMQVNKHASYYWHQLPNATGNYLASLTRRLSELDVQTSLLQVPLSNPIYIDLDVEEIENDKYNKASRRKKRAVVNLEDCVLHNKVSLLEAEMGFGKSRLARRIVSNLAAPVVLKQNKVLPIFATFKAFSEMDVVDIEMCVKKLIGEETFLEATRDGCTYFLVLDGVDEANSNLDVTREIITKIVEQVRQTSNYRVLLTSRPFKLLESSPFLAASTKRYQIKPISTTKLIRFIREVCIQSNLPTKLYQDLAKSDLFKQLPQNPIAASLLSNLLQQHKQDLPSNLTELYAKSVDYMLGRWDEKRGLSTEKTFKASERVVRHIAKYMIDNQIIYISTNEAREMVQQYLRERNTGVKADDIFDHIMNRSHLFGVLQDTETIFFRHRSFAEYLYAQDAHATRNFAVDKKVFHPYWTNTYFFYLGLLSECPEILRQLASTSPEGERAKWIKILQMSNYFLAGYQTPYVVVEESLDGLLIEAAELYLEIRKGNTHTKLNSLSEMNLLWLFATLLKNAYGYDYFKKALPLSMVKIEDSLIYEREPKQVALFFAATILGELNDKCGFHHLLACYKTEELPLSISLGLQCEVDFAGKDFANDPVIKGHIKKLRKALSNSKVGANSTNPKVTELFDTPVITRFSAKISEVKQSGQLIQSKPNTKAA
jgi:hypothetical protein